MAHSLIFNFRFLRARKVLAAATALTAAAALSVTASTSAANAAALPPIRHVFVIMLENEGYASTFGDPAADPYLATTLPSQGALLTQYYGTGHYSNDNYISFISGQAPNVVNQQDCTTFSPFQFLDGILNLNIGGQWVGSGCVYPSVATTVANQLTQAGDTWKAYEEDMGNDPARDNGTVCAHPTVGAADPTQTAETGDGYATRHDPFVYFKSIIGNSAYCDAHVVPLGTTSGVMPPGTPAGTTGLATDLASAATTPNFSFITPDLCDDGHDYPCANETIGNSALADIDSFLQTWVPLITSSPAFQQNGLLEIAFDEADGTVPNVDATACCNEYPQPLGPAPGQSGPGGGVVGAVLLSPFITPGTVTATPYNHFSSLATTEDLFGLPLLGEAATVTSTFGPDVFTNPGG
jgi:hypothetical protein